MRELIAPSSSKIIMLVLDGLGGLPREPGGKTELETARTPHLDSLALKSALGLSQPAGPGITVGSGPGHLALFGYDPVVNNIGRGALEALGVDFDLGPDDLAARGNFCTLDKRGLVVDRRAGRLSTASAQELADLLNNIKIEGAEFELRIIKEHRFAFVMRSPRPGRLLSDTDPLKTGGPPLAVQPGDERSEKTARLLNLFLNRAQILLADHSPANMIMLRGFSLLPTLPSFKVRYGLKAGALALNGMYRGVAKLAGMKVLDIKERTMAGEFEALSRHYENYNFFYIHIKETDTCGEKGDFDGKVAVIEEVDRWIPHIMQLNPDVVLVGGDHSSPAVMQSHSWHPVPALLYSRLGRPDGIGEFGERACLKGSLGVLPAQNLMPLLLANAGRLKKYGA